MKSRSVVVIVVACHVLAVASVVLIQGCGTTSTTTTAVGPATPPPEPVMPGRTEARPAAVTLPTPSPVAEKPAKAWPAETTTYVVAKGDFLSLIAQRFDLSVAEIMALNGLKNANSIRAGQRLMLPGKVNLTAPRPAVKAKPTAVSGSASAAAQSAGAVTSANTYVVKPGDSLSKIAARSGATSKSIREANRLSGDKVMVGQKLVIPVATSAGKGTPAPSAAAAPAFATTPAASPVAAPAALKETPVVPDANLDAEPIHPQAAQPSAAPAPAAAAPVVAPAATAPAAAAPVVAPAPAAPAAAPAPAGAGVKAPTSGKGNFGVHVVDADEDLYSVAMMWGVSVEDIKRLNGLQDTKLTPGQRLKIPMAE